MEDRTEDLVFIGAHTANRCDRVTTLSSHPRLSPHPWNIWGSVPGHGSPPPPLCQGDKMEREGIRLTVRCVTRSCVNEKQVERARIPPPPPPSGHSSPLPKVGGHL